MSPRPLNKRAAAEARGRRGEGLAAWYLRLKGWRIVARRARTPLGEIDLIARRGSTLAFVEVKWRARAADLATAIDERRLQRVARAAEALVAALDRLSLERKAPVTAGLARDALADPVYGHGHWQPRLL